MQQQYETNSLKICGAKRILRTIIFSTALLYYFGIIILLLHFLPLLLLLLVLKLCLPKVTLRKCQTNKPTKPLRYNNNKSNNISSIGKNKARRPEMWHPGN